MQALQHGAAGPRRYSEAPSGLHCPSGKADKIVEQAAQAQYSDGEATYVEVYAKTLPTLLTAALDAHEEALEQLDGSRLGRPA